MRIPSVPPAASDPNIIFRSYPCFVSSGIAIVPMVAAVSFVHSSTAISLGIRFPQWRRLRVHFPFSNDGPICVIPRKIGEADERSSAPLPTLTTASLFVELTAITFCRRCDDPTGSVVAWLRRHGDHVDRQADDAAVHRYRRSHVHRAGQAQPDVGPSDRRVDGQAQRCSDRMGGRRVRPIAGNDTIKGFTPLTLCLRCTPQARGIPRRR